MYVVPSSSSACAEALRALPRRLAVPDDADLREDARDAAAARDPPDGQRAASSLEACAHAQRDHRVGRGGNAGCRRREPESRGTSAAAATRAARPAARSARYRSCRLPETAVVHAAGRARAPADARSSAAAPLRAESVKSRALLIGPPPFARLEPNVLERLGRGAVEVCCKPVVAAPGREIATRDPGGGAMAGRAELAEARLGGGERRLGLVEAILLEQRASEHELRAADLVEVVLAGRRAAAARDAPAPRPARRCRCADGSARATTRPARRPRRGPCRARCRTPPSAARSPRRSCRAGSSGRRGCS